MGIPLNLYGFVYSDSPTRSNSNSTSGYVIVDANILKVHVLSAHGPEYAGVI